MTDFAISGQPGLAAALGHLGEKLSANFSPSLLPQPREDVIVKVARRPSEAFMVFPFSAFG
ncbi:MAG TPA: hypothetical protein VF524_15645 [Polyangia bacterium]